MTITDPPDDVVFEAEVPVPMRDGVTLRANVFRPREAHECPTLVCAHPYGKNGLPRPRQHGDGVRYSVPFQFRVMGQSSPIEISAWTSWEAPDPAYWVGRGYALVNCDLRGWGTSGGTGEILSAQEGRDYHDLIEWAAAQPWSNGRIGLLGVSYLAITQWAAAAERPPHLAAICPWEGFSDAYHDLVRRGGVLEHGFVRLWTAVLRRARRSPVHVLQDAKRHPCFDEHWEAMRPELARVDVPALVCASFSDHNLHSGGTFEGFRQIGSREKWLFTHRGGKWAVFYSEAGRAVQAKFFDHFLRGDNTGIERRPRVTIEVREDAETITAVRDADDWPPPGTTWTPWYPTADGSLDPAAPAGNRVHFDLRRGRVRFALRFHDDCEMVGPMWMRLYVELEDADDACLFVGVRKRRRGRVVGFEGSYGFDRALVTFGMTRASHRTVNTDPVAPWSRVDADRTSRALRAGEIVPLDVVLAPHATLFRTGEELLVDVQGRWFFPTNPLVGQFPARYERSRHGRCVVHLGGDTPSALYVPTAGPAPARG